MMVEKTKISQDFLYKYLLEHDVILTLLATEMGVSEGIVYGSFRHLLNRHGKPLNFSKANIIKLNDALVRIADELRRSVLNFGSDRAFTNQRGTTYDPALIEPIRDGVGKFFKLRGFTERLLGWNKAKLNFVLSAPSSKIYGCISKEDVDRINAELLSVAGVLSSCEVVADGDTL